MKILLRSRHLQKLESEALINSLFSGEAKEIKISTWSPYETRFVAERIGISARRFDVTIKIVREQGCVVARIID